MSDQAEEGCPWCSAKDGEACDCMDRDQCPLAGTGMHRLCGHCDKHDRPLFVCFNEQNGCIDNPFAPKERRFFKKRTVPEVRYFAASEMIPVRVGPSGIAVVEGSDRDSIPIGYFDELPDYIAEDFKQISRIIDKSELLVRLLYEGVLYEEEKKTAPPSREQGPSAVEKAPAAKPRGVQVYCQGDWLDDNEN